MSETAWISVAPGHPSNMRPFRNDVAESSPDRLQSLIRRMKAGEPIAADDAPREVFAAPHARDGDYKLPDLFYAYGYWIVSDAAAQVLRNADLGAGGLYPVRVLRSDRRTPIGGDWSCLDIGNAKRSFVPEQSRNVDPRSAGQWLARAALGDGDIALSGAAAAGPDIWIEPLVRDAIFLGDSLARALRKAKADKGFFLKSCRLIQI